MYHCFMDIADIAECALLILPSPEAFTKNQAPSKDDYYVHIKLSATRGTLYRSCHISSYSSWGTPQEGLATESSDKVAIATLHFKVFVDSQRSWTSSCGRI